MKILLFELEGVLQSWGEHSKWNIRDSAEWPTKSGIIGMISAAIGYGYDDKRIGELCNAVSFGVKTKQSYIPLLDDFQTVDYMGGVLANGNRENREQQRTIAQNKYYIMDKKFLIALSGEEETLKMIYDAMLSPKWAMHLGRACCIPSKPIIPKIVEYNNIEEALRNVPLYDCKEVIQIESESGERRMDARIATDGKHYRERFVETKVI